MFVNGPFTSSAVTMYFAIIGPFPAAAARRLYVARSRCAATVAVPRAESIAALGRVVSDAAAPLNHRIAFAALSPHVASMIPGEKPARSSRISSWSAVAPRVKTDTGNRVGFAPKAAGVMCLNEGSLAGVMYAAYWAPI